MNTVRSFWLGWGSVCVAGAGAYYFAKKEINADRQAKLDQNRRQRQINREMEYGASSTSYRDGSSEPPSASDALTPGPDQAPPRERSKYEGPAAYKSQKGDRFS